MTRALAAAAAVAVMLAAVGCGGGGKAHHDTTTSGSGPGSAPATADREPSIALHLQGSRPLPSGWGDTRTTRHGAALLTCWAVPPSIISSKPRLL